MKDLPVQRKDVCMGRGLKNRIASGQLFLKAP